MRILFLVLLTVVALVGIGLGGMGAWSGTVGPMHEKMAEMEKTAKEADAVGVLMGKSELFAGKDIAGAGDIMRQGLRGYRVAQIGGAVVALLDIALLVLALRRRSREILITGGVALAVGIACFLLTPPRALDETMYGIDVALAISAAASALFAWLSDKTARRPGTAPAPAMARG
jgi:hypothetical protein